MAKIFLTNETSDVTGYKNAYVDTRRPTSTTIASAITTVPVAAAAGTTTSVTATAGGTAVKWITKPFLTAATIAGSIGMTGWLSSVSTGVLAGLNVNLNFYTNTTETTTPFLVDLVRSQGAQTSVAQFKWHPTQPTSQAFAIGDRLVVHVNAVTLGCTGTTETITLDYDSPTEGIDGDTYIQLTETIRVGSRQSAASGGASYVGEGRGQFQESINKLNQWVAANVISSSSTVQAALDDLGRESANN